MVRLMNNENSACMLHVRFYMRHLALFYSPEYSHLHAVENSVVDHFS